MPETLDFLLLGAGRGGTSLLAGVLDRHSHLEVGFEAFSVAYLMGQNLQAPDPSRLAQTRTEAFIAACLKESRRFPGQRWGNKITTEQLAGLEDHNQANPDAPLDILDYFFNQALAGVPVIFILRDGRTCVRSKIQRTGQSLELACARWRYSVQVYRFLQTRPASLCCRYEDLVRQPEAGLRALCAFLGLDYEPTMLEGTDNPKMLTEYRHGQFDTGKLNLDGIPAGCEALIQDELRACGYLESSERR